MSRKDCSDGWLHDWPRQAPPSMYNPIAPLSGCMTGQAKQPPPLSSVYNPIAPILFGGWGMQSPRQICEGHEAVVNAACCAFYMLSGWRG